MLVVLATLAGLTVPPLIASARVVWPQVVAAEQMPAAHGVQALLGDLGGVAGPALAGALAAVASSSGALIACAVLPVAGALLLVALPWPERAPRQQRGGALASAGMRMLVVADIGLYAAWGALEVALPALAGREGAAASAAIPLAAFAAASAVGSLVYGTRPAAADRRYVLGALALVARWPLAALGSVWAVAAVLLAAEAAFAAVNVATFALLDEAAPKGTGAEALTWLTTAGAAGMAAAGALAGAGSVALALALPSVAAGVAAVAVRARRGTLNGAG